MVLSAGTGYPRIMKTGTRVISHCNALHVRLTLWADERGQDLIEYALMAGFVAVAAGSIMPGVANSISTIFSKVASVMSRSATQGS